jgi:uncharacterized protein YbjT (DUF2867 family)
MVADLLGVTGAGGGVGGRVARRLAAMGRPQVLIVRHPSQAPDLPGAHVRLASYQDTAAMRSALDGVRTLLMVSGREAPDRVDHHRSVIEAAAAAGIERIVYLSFLNADDDSTFTFARDHSRTESEVRASGLGFTFLRDSLYADIVPHLVVRGAIRGPAGRGRVAWIARDDIADVAVRVLTEGGHDHNSYDLTGPRSLTMEETAATVSRVSGAEIGYLEETIEEAWESRAVYDAPTWEVEGWISTYTAIAAGELDTVSDTVEALTGRQPMTLEEFLRRNPESWARL